MYLSIINPGETVHAMPSRSHDILRALLMSVTAVALAAAAIVVPLAAAPAEAASVDLVKEFEPGKIIDDALFYDGAAMTTAQVQTFLDKQMPKCEIGTKYKAGSAWGSTKVADFCLKNAKFTTQSRAANSYCKAYAGAKNESAAAIVAKVGRACGISPKVLLVMLEKEQSLVTDTWPTVRQFNVAMGYACPDSGPNNSASCDPSQTGFMQQVYRGAWQLEVYKAFPDSYRYRAGQSNTVQWHPNASCGTSTFKIENSATAALYIYTPYRPNEAALRAGWGTGNSCSTYGNRNFFHLYRTWFGATQESFTINGEVRKYYSAKGGAKKFGKPLENKSIISANGGGVYQLFAKGLIAYSKTSKKAFFVPKGSTLSAYRTAGGPAGAWGWPTAAQRYTAKTGVYETRFQQGTAVHRPNYGAKFVQTRTLKVWNANGGASGKLGYPQQHTVATGSSTSYQRFEKGAVVMLSASKSVVLTKTVSAAWQAAGGYAALGLATASHRSLGEQGWYLPTQKGVLFKKSDRPALFVPQVQLLTDYLAAGGPAKLGWPATALNCKLAGGGCKLSLDGRTAVWSEGSGTAYVASQHYKYWVGFGDDRFSEFGYPVGATRTVGTATVQQYENGTVTRASDGTFTWAPHRQRRTAPAPDALEQPASDPAPSDEPALEEATPDEAARPEDAASESPLQ